MFATFEHGVASGDPWSDSIVLWTRVSPSMPWGEQLPEEIGVDYCVYPEADVWTGRCTQRGSSPARASHDYTVKETVSGLDHSTSYAFVFTVGAAMSTTGRFRLPPPAGESLDRLHYAIFSCSSWAWGFFNAFGAAARRSQQQKRLDFWMHVGDYYYEDGHEQTYPRADQAVRWTGLEPPTETITLHDYRLRHALHRADVDLQALSAEAPLIAVWDDHEIANDPWVGGAVDHNPEHGEGDWWVRKRAAVRAYHEWMPTRTPPPDACTADAESVSATAAEVAACRGTHAGERTFRHFRFGSLAALHMLETRLLARAEQAVANATAIIADIVADTPPQRWATTAEVVGRLAALNTSWQRAREPSERELLGAEQLAWLSEGIGNASYDGVVWQLVGQQIIVQPRRPCDLARAAAEAPSAALRREWQETLANLTAANWHAKAVRRYDNSASGATRRGKVAAITRREHAQTKAMLAMAQFGLNADFDGWDGYPAARRRLLDALRGVAGGRAAVYAGDSHAAWAGQLVSPEDGRHIALEFDGPRCHDASTSPPMPPVPPVPPLPPTPSPRPRWLTHIHKHSATAGTSATSSGPDTWFDYLPPPLLEAAYITATDTLTFADTDQRGWMEVTLTPRTHAVAFMTVDNVGSREYAVGCAAAFEQHASSPHLLRKVECAHSEMRSGGSGRHDADGAGASRAGLLMLMTGVGVAVGGAAVALLLQRRGPRANQLLKRFHVQSSIASAGSESGLSMPPSAPSV